MSNETQGQGIKNIDLTKGQAKLSGSQVCPLPLSVHLFHASSSYFNMFVFITERGTERDREIKTSMMRENH